MNKRILEDLRTSAAAFEPKNETEAQLEMFEIEEQIAAKHSVVKREYKIKYKIRAAANGLKGKVAKRSTWDWLAQIMAEQTLNKNKKTDVDALYEFFDINEVDHSNWTSRTPGWEGRLRMTGGLALRRIIAERGTLWLRDGSEVEVPEEELARLRAKYDF
jgi:hypothetical protein